MFTDRARNACETVWELQLLLVRWGIPRVLVNLLVCPLEWAFMAVFGRRTVADWWGRWILMILEMRKRSEGAPPR